MIVVGIIIKDRGVDKEGKCFTIETKAEDVGEVTEMEKRMACLLKKKIEAEVEKIAQVVQLANQAAEVLQGLMTDKKKGE